MTILARSLSGYQVEITADHHQWISDEPLGTGDDAGPCPFDLLLSALASCTIITLNMYARRKNWPLEQVELSMDISRTETQAQDGRKETSSVIETRLTLHGPLTPEQLKRLQDISTRCPVHRTITGDIQIHSTVSNIQN